jgi:alkylation response protein AidB-like acyl-CoA dehydrogenase
MQLRTEAARAGWCRAGVSAADEAASQFAIGYLNLAMRDAVGLGHARMLQGQPGADCGRVIALAEAGALVGVAVTEPSGGTNVSRLNTRAVPDPATGEWHIVGRKVWISRLDEASWWLVYLNSNSSVQVGLVPANAPGLTRIPRRSSGFDEVSWGELCLDAVPLAYDMLLGGDDGLTTFRRHFARWRLLVAAACCGAAAFLLDAAFHHLKYRFAQGRQPSDLSLGRLGSCVTRVAMASEYVSMATSTWDRSGYLAAFSDLQGRRAKAFAVDVAIEAASEARLVLGAGSFAADSPVGRQSLSLEAFRFADGVQDSMYRAIGLAEFCAAGEEDASS